MTAPNERPIAEFAKDVADACRKLTGFRAIQTIEAGPIRLVAQVGRHRPDRLDVDVESYDNPLLELEERLTGDTEFTPEEIVRLSVHSDGRRTWLYDASSGVCLVRPLGATIEPLPEFPLLGEVDYLRELPHDYLLRDGGLETIEGRETRSLTLKPKRAVRGHAFKRVAFLADKATVAFERETLFPIRLQFRPASTTQSHPLVGPDGTITVSYRSVRLASEPPSPFEPPKGTRLFEEQIVPIGELGERSPFAASFAALDAAGYTPIDGRARLAEDRERGRGYVVMTYIRHPENGDGTESIVTVRVGNYLSRNMARRRSAQAEHGEAITLAGRDARLLDRRSLWEEHASGLDPSHAPCELGWQTEGVFWFLIGLNLDRDTLTDLGESLASEPPIGGSETPASDERAA